MHSLPLHTLLAISLTSSYAFAAAPDRAERIIRAGETQVRGKSSQVLMKMKIHRRSYSRELQVRAWSSGNRNALVEILAPSKEQGVSSLRSGTQMWNYLPRIDQVVRVPTSLMMQSWMGSDFTNDDLMKASSLANDYRHKILYESRRQGTVLIECRPKAGAAVVWGKVLYLARISDSLPLKQSFYDDRGVLVRTLTFKSFKKMDDRIIPTQISVRVAATPREYTTVRYQKVLFDRDLTSHVFNRDRLRTNSHAGKALSRGWVTRPMKRTAARPSSRRYLVAGYQE